MRQLGKFCVVGGIGFVVDSLCFIALLLFTDSLILARLCSFWIAATAVWLGNRQFTFKHRNTGSAWHQCLRHMLAAHLGGSINMLFFGVACQLTLLPVAFCLGIAAGLLANYLLSSRFVFKTT